MKHFALIVAVLIVIVALVGCRDKVATTDDRVAMATRDEVVSSSLREGGMSTDVPTLKEKPVDISDHDPEGFPDYIQVDFCLGFWNGEKLHYNVVYKHVGQVTASTLVLTFIVNEGFPDETTESLVEIPVPEGRGALIAGDIPMELESFESFHVVATFR